MTRKIFWTITFVGAKWKVTKREAGKNSRNVNKKSEASECTLYRIVPVSFFRTETGFGIYLIFIKPIKTGLYLGVNQG